PHPPCPFLPKEQFVVREFLHPATSLDRTQGRQVLLEFQIHRRMTSLDERDELPRKQELVLRLFSCQHRSTQSVNALPEVEVVRVLAIDLYDEECVLLHHFLDRRFDCQPTEVVQLNVATGWQIAVQRGGGRRASSRCVGRADRVAACSADQGAGSERRGQGEESSARRDLRRRARCDEVHRIYPHGRYSL